jgi:hypothetical protein
MLVVLLSWLSHFIVFKTWGNIVTRVFRIKGISWLNELLMGYCFLSLVSVCYSLFMPINAWMHLGLFVFSLLYLVANKITINFVRNIEKHSLLFYLLIGACILILALPEPNHGDSSFYHAQALQWVEQYKAVPGLANLFGRLGFNSSFFNVQALFSFHPFSNVSARFLNSFLVLIWAIFLFQNILNKSFPLNERLLSLSFLLISLTISRGWVSSVAPDVAVGIFMLAIGFYMVRDLPHLRFNGAGYQPPLLLRQAQQTRGGFVSPNFLCILLATAITIKLSALFLLPIVAGFIVFQKKVNHTLFVIPSLVGIAWVARNIIVSGYLVYPYLPMPFANLDWAVTAEQAQIEENWISSWAKIPSESWEYVLSLSFLEWFPQWFALQSLFNKLLTLTLGFIWLNIIFMMIKKLLQKQPLVMALKLLFLWGMVIAIWLFIAPDYRFAYGFVLPFIIGFVLPHPLFCLIRPSGTFSTGEGKWQFSKIGFWSKSFQKWSSKTTNNNLIIEVGKYAYVLLLVGFTVYVIQKQSVPLARLVIMPEAYKTVKTYDIKLNKTIIHVAPLENNCNNTCIPCVNADLIPKGLEMRGEKMENGFRCR